MIHFCEAMGRSLFTSFVHKHAKVRMAGLRALFDVLCTGIWKNSVYVFEAMIGFRDPNIVPIKEFYDPSTKVNYFAMFIADRSIACRQCFYKTMAKLLLDLPDRVDHEGRVFPYLISGLYDPNDDIKNMCFELIEEIGLRHEEENEEKFREIKQFGFVPVWMHGGKITDQMVTLPSPISHRPRLGSRILVRSYVRRYLRALYKEIGDWIQEHQERASHLLLYSICYVEDFMTQYMDHLLVAMYKAILNKECKTVMKNVPHSFRLLGRYVNPSSYGPLVIQAIRNELASFYSYTSPGSLKSFGYIFSGSIELLISGQDLAHVSDTLRDFIRAIQDTVIESIDIETADHLLETLDTMFTTLILKQSEGIDIRIIEDHLPSLLNFILKCQAAYITYKLQKKEDPASITLSKERGNKCLKMLDKLSGKEADYFDSQIVNIFEKNWSQLLVQYEEWLEEEKKRPPPEEPKDEEQEEIKKKKKEKEEEEKLLPKPEDVPTDEESKAQAKKFLMECFEAHIAEEEAKKAAAEAKKKAKEDRENGIIPEEPEPVIKEEDMQLVPVEEPQEPELLEVDTLLAIKNWAMQSPDWKFFNVLFEMLNEKQLQYKCDNGKTIFDMVASLLKLGLTKPQSREKSEEKAMTQVKAYIISYLVPKAINSSLSFVSADLSLTYLGLLEQSMAIEQHLKDYNPILMSHYEVILQMHQQLLECKGVKLDTKHIASYEPIFRNFLKTIKIKKENHKVCGYKILK